ncbi:hypothetical protein SASPL_149226 [Salvia splendens]|uniref:N-acetyltransferase domain-containing protein n=1 Tax=Salvia splendens TaxID=180675 RepID=A0A8X8WCE7_SALSN|nr:hypothetical protein SASPL_149226 [Salvia splendens]
MQTQTICLGGSFLNLSATDQIKNLKHQPFSCTPNLSHCHVSKSGFPCPPQLSIGLTRTLSYKASLELISTQNIRGLPIPVIPKLQLPRFEDSPFRIIEDFSCCSRHETDYLRIDDERVLVEPVKWLNYSPVSPEIVVREARIEDCWEVAETHCSSFFPEFSFPLDFVLRIDRLIGMLFGLSLPKGCQRTCLVAVTGTSSEEVPFFLGSDDLRIGSFDGKLSLCKGYVAGILTVDTVADFLPQKGPINKEGIAYISNVAVRERYRRKGIAKTLVAKAEAKAKSWGCRAIALHSDLTNPGATKLYLSRGFRCIELPAGANWPQPRTSPEMEFNFMMKLLNSTDSRGLVRKQKNTRK